MPDEKNYCPSGCEFLYTPHREGDQPPALAINSLKSSHRLNPRTAAEGRRLQLQALIDVNPNLIPAFCPHRRHPAISTSQSEPVSRQ